MNAPRSEMHATPSQHPALCVDLDGTLVRTDTLVESALAAVKSQPTLLLHIPGWLLSGRAVLKRELAARAELDPSLLPYNECFIEYLRLQRIEGRRLFLTTAADQRIAQSVAKHLGVFDEVIASDGIHNLKGSAKAAVLVEQFGDRGFSYAGSDRHDVPVWTHAASVVAVNAPPSILDSASRCAPIEYRIDERRSNAAALLRALRPYQWAKNILVFVPIVTSGAFLDTSAWMSALITFVAFCLSASGIYLVNDLSDLEADRKHKRKRGRPLAHGDVSLVTAATLVPAMIVLGLACAEAVGALWSVICYIVLSLAYSLGLKSSPLVDIFLLAGLYMVRLFAGGEVTQYPVSLWLLAFAGFLFFNLATIKRVAEITATDTDEIPRRGYRSGDKVIIQQMGVAAAFVSCMVLALYIQSDIVSGRYARPEILWGIVPLILFWQCRLWLSTARGYMHDDPIVYTFRDWVSWLCGATLLVVVIVAYVS